MAVDSLDFGDALAAMPEQLAVGARGRGEGAGVGAPRRRRRSIASSRWAWAAPGIAGNILQAVGTATHARAGHRAEALPHARVRQRPHPRVRALVLGRHRGDARDGARRARGGRHAGRASRAAASSHAWRRNRGRCTCRAPTTSSCRGSRSARWSRRSFVVLFRMGMLPGGARRAAAGAGAARSAGATSAGPTVEGAAQPRARAGAQDRSHDPDRLRHRRPRAGWRRCGGSSR